MGDSTASVPGGFRKQNSVSSAHSRGEGRHECPGGGTRVKRLAMR